MSFRNTTVLDSNVNHTTSWAVSHVELPSQPTQHFSCLKRVEKVRQSPGKPVFFWVALRSYFNLPWSYLIVYCPSLVIPRLKNYAKSHREFKLAWQIKRELGIWLSGKGMQVWVGRKDKGSTFIYLNSKHRQVLGQGNKNCFWASLVAQW